MLVEMHFILDSTVTSSHSSDTPKLAPFYPIGEPGRPWGEGEHTQWRAAQSRRRTYADDVLARIDALPGPAEVLSYGELVYGEERYPLKAVRPAPWVEGRPLVLVTGGVHGYETSGVHGALQFLEERAVAYAGKVNLLVVPCVSPWGYERVHRWNHFAIDPNRSFKMGGQAQEALALTAFVTPWLGQFTAHLDLHETTDTDESEYRPALAARDGEPFVPGVIPDGFYLVDDTEHPQPAFQQAILAAVGKVTHIAPADEKGELFGTPVASPGVIRYPIKSMGLCTSLTGAPFTSTTEVYPDSPTVTPQQCNDAQVVAVCAALDFLLIQAP